MSERNPGSKNVFISVTARLTAGDLDQQSVWAVIDKAVYLAFRFLALIPCLPFPGAGNATFEP